jgi:hypothetical protein
LNGPGAEAVSLISLVVGVCNSMAAQFAQGFWAVAKASASAAARVLDRGLLELGHVRLLPNAGPDVGVNAPPEAP